LVFLPGAFALLSRLGQGTQFVVPFRLKGVGNQAIAWVDQHESALRQIGFELCTVDRAAAQAIGILLPSFDLSPNIERQLHGGRRHPFSHQGANGLIDGWTQVFRV
jgi:hypothetical protein